MVSACLHGGLLAAASLLDFAPVHAGWNGNDPSAWGGDGEPPAFTIRVRVPASEGEVETAVMSVDGALTPPAASEPLAASADHPLVPPIVDDGALDWAEIRPDAIEDERVASAPERDSATIPAWRAESPSPESHAPNVSIAPDSGLLRSVPLDRTSASPAPTPPAADLAASTPSVESGTREDRNEAGTSDGDASTAGTGHIASKVGETTTPASENTGSTGSGGAGASTSPTLSFAPKPPYPLLSTRLGEEGEVHLSLVVSRDGRVVSVSVVRGSGFARLDRAAVETLERWRFEPLEPNDERATFRFQHRVTFRLK